MALDCDRVSSRLKGSAGGRPSGVVVIALPTEPAAVSMVRSRLPEVARPARPAQLGSGEGGGARRTPAPVEPSSQGEPDEPLGAVGQMHSPSRDVPLKCPLRIFNELALERRQTEALRIKPAKSIQH